jgi:hypothetical protein
VSNLSEKTDATRFSSALLVKLEDNPLENKLSLLVIYLIGVVEREFRLLPHFFG